MTIQQSSPGDPDPGQDPPRRDEDLAALLERLLAQAQDRTQKDLAAEAGISYPTLNAWMNRTRGTSRIDPEKLRAMVEVFRRWGVRTTPREFFEAVGRPVPGPSGDEREARLLKLYRQLPEARQRALLKDAEAMLQVSRIG
ncbi:helix-turn-helix transcriptional regulator [Streptomyces sp. HUAS 31]|uniref:HTH cro/C1-type domain-containing protein n=1 Tax=Streptomyces osmaniensis TaxID=593134 RepID=A0ABP6YJQ9_9ACTN|nr:helix-turn-helix transcriptional regulator [Streptomyces sp. HUAS 31]WCD99840.1 helix-turn-helix transcriptional regulator [Streptomyces sp. HUAS 31]